LSTDFEELEQVAADSHSAFEEDYLTILSFSYFLLFGKNRKRKICERSMKPLNGISARQKKLRFVCRSL